MEIKTWKDWLENKGLSKEEIDSTIPYTISATVRLVSEDEEYLKIASQLEETDKDFFVTAGVKKEDIFEAAPSMVVDGKPRMLHASAFIAHEGFNNNRDGFISEELKAIVENNNLFKAPYAGILDYHHDLNPIGYWYDAQYVFDPEASKYGILAQGAIWAWRFREISDRLLAEQSREGKVNVSMACLSKNIEPVDTPEGRKSILHNPVFVAASMLTEAPPADFYGRSVVEDESQNTGPDGRSKLVTRVATVTPNNKNMEVNLMEKEDLVNLLNQALGKSDDAVITKVTDFIEAKIAEVKDELGEKDTALTEANTKIATLESTIEDLTNASEEKDVAFSSLKSESASLEAKVAELEEELNTYRETEAARKLEETKNARLAQVSDSVRATLDEMDDEKKVSIITRWASLTDEEWSARIEELNLAAHNKQEETPRNGVLPNVTPAQKTNSLDRFIK